MKNIKLIVITILMVINSSFVFANNEVIEKDGNTTKIKLLDEEDNENSNKKLFENSNNKSKYDTLLGNNLDEEETANNYVFVASNESYTSNAWRSSGSNGYNKSLSISSWYNAGMSNLSGYYDDPLSAGTSFQTQTLIDETIFKKVVPIEYKDSFQNHAVATLNNIKMTQNNDYYFFNVDITYSSNITKWKPDTLILLPNSYQFINNGKLYLSNKSISNINYHYMGYASESSNATFKSDGWTRDTGSSSGYTSQLIHLDINNGDYSVTQRATNNGEGIQNDVNGQTPSALYSTLIYPFQEYVWNNVYTNAMRSLTSITKGGVSLSLNFRNSRPLFTGGQPNLVEPIRPLETDVSVGVCTITKNNGLDYWNNTFKTQIRIKKSDFNNYKYLNMYAPQAVIVHNENNLNKVNSSSYQETVSSNNYINYQYRRQPQTLIKAKSVHSENAIDLSNYINCEHEWFFFENPYGDKINHLKKCRFCEWEIEEQHELTCEYDGFTNNLCHLCGYTDNVVIDIYADDNQIIQERVGAYNSGTQLKSYTPYPANFQTILDTFTYEKTGYLWKGYKTIKAKIPVSKESYSSINTPLKTSDEIIKYINGFPPLIASKSTILQLNYEPIEYYIELQSETNKGTFIFTTGTIDGAYLYDKEYQVPFPSISGEYSFVGWSKTQYSDTAEYTDTFKNLTTINNEVVKLYPVLDEKHYKFKFSKINNLNINLATYSNIDDLKCYFNTDYNLPNNINVEGYEFKGWSLIEKGNSVDFVPNAPIYNYTNMEKVFTLFPVYEPHKYFFNFSRNNILGLNIEQLEQQVFNYGEENKIKNNFVVNGYVFKGWSLIASSSNIDFLPNQKILNYTNKNNMSYTLYPIYEELVFRIIYSTSNGIYSNGSNSITKDYTLETLVNFEIPNIPKRLNRDKYGKTISEDYASFVSYIDDNKNEFKTVNSLKEVIYNNNINKLIFNLHYNYKFVRNDIRSSGGGGGSSGSDGGGNSGNSFNKDNVADNNIDKEQYSSLESSNILNNINGKSQKKKKDIVTFLNEIYDDWKEQNNLNIKRRFDIIDLIKAIYEDFSNKHD